jgi:two-component system sensor histidine kinase CpxA
LLRLALVTLISAIVSFFMARSLVAPLERLRKTSQRLAEGDFSARTGQLVSGRRDEIGQLAQDLDVMAGQIQTLDQARTRLLRDVSHELRSPLARLQVALELARGRSGGLATNELQRIGLEADRLDELIGQVLALLRQSSPQPLHRTEIHLRELLRQLVEAGNYEAGTLADAAVSAQPVRLLAEQEIVFSGEREYLTRAFENILRNAIRYTNLERGVEVTLEADNERVQIQIRDFGPGVPASSLMHLFEPFYRVQEARDRESGGYGLGMAIAERAIKRHGGEISAANAEGGGLLVQIVLPRATAA